MSEAALSDKLTGVLEIARLLAEREEWEAAAQMLRPLAEAAPGAIELWLQIARWESRDGRGAQAQSTLRHALQLNHDREEAHVLPLWLALSESCYDTQRWDGCIEACKRVVKIRPRGGPKNHNIWDMLATALAHQGRFDAAIEAVREVLLTSPRDALQRMRLASLLQAQDRSGEAVREFERVLAMTPDTQFGRDAEIAIEALDRTQIQQILLRAGEQRAFGLHLERDIEGTLAANAFYLSDSGHETLRQLVWDGRAEDATPKAPHVH